jgi:PAB1-binding protein PBP1
MLLGVGLPTHQKEATSDPKKRKFDLLKSLMEVRKVAKKELKYFNSQVSDQISKKSLGQLKQEIPKIG